MTTICIGPPMSWVIGLLIGIYLATAAYLWRYLQAHHSSVWQWMGSPIFTRPTLLAVKSSIYTLWFALSPKPEELRDPKLNRIAWAFRSELVLIMVLWWVSNRLGWLPPPTCTTT
jgi:hypothetical protein